MKSWVVGNPKVFGITHSLFRDSELIQITLLYKGEQLVQQIATITTQKANPGINQPTEGEVFMGMLHFPMAGCVDGWFFEDYFPNGSSTLREDGEMTLISAKTKYGDADAWLSSEYPKLPVRIVITKVRGDIASANRVVGEFLSDPDAANSVVESVRHEFIANEFAASEDGIPYYKSCEIMSEITSQRGVEGTIKTSWHVDELYFDHRVLDGGVFPKPEIDQRGQFTVKGADQVPYVWSEKEQWAVPDVRYAAQPLPLKGSKRGYFVVAGVLLLFLAIGFVYWTKRR